VVHNHHNFAWIEEHGGERLYVIRKGATPAFPGQKGFVGGSMGDDAVILQGARRPMRRRSSSRRARCTRRCTGGPRHEPHRGRGEAHAKGKVLKEGAISPEMMHDWVKRKG